MAPESGISFGSGYFEYLLSGVLWQLLQLRQIESGIITWVCTNSPTALDASVTTNAVCACQTG